MRINSSIKKEQKFDTIIQITSIENCSQQSKKSFSLITFILSVFNVGSNLIDFYFEKFVLPFTLFYDDVVQFVGGMWKYQINNTFNATTIASYGAFWISFAISIFLVIPKIESVQKTTGFFLLSWFIFTLYMNFVAWRISKTVFSIFTILNLTFLFLIIGNFSDVSIITNIGGLCGIITAILAWYASIAVTINITFKKSILPVGTYQLKERKTSIISIDF